MICEYIDGHRQRFGVEPICAVLSEHGVTIAPATFYKWLDCPITAAQLEEAYLVNDIVDLYRKNKWVYGVRKMWRAARRVGLRLGRDQVGRLMRIAGTSKITNSGCSTSLDHSPGVMVGLTRRRW